MSLDVTVVQQSLSAFKEAFNNGIKGIVQASDIYVKSIGEDPSNAEKFREYFADSIPSAAWSNFEAIGRKWMHPQLIMGGMNDRKKASKVKRLPYDMQEKVFQHTRFPLLLSDGETLQVSIQDATPEQVEQLVDGGTIRSESAQKAYLESMKTRKTVQSAESLPYTILNGRVTFRRNTVMSRAELRRIIAEM